MLMLSRYIEFNHRSKWGEVTCFWKVLKDIGIIESIII
jgi:hypothetical protein